MSACSVGIDVGGTFTDLVSIDADGQVAAAKVLSTPSDQSGGVMAALSALAASDVGRIVHGTTVATNALLERTGARVVLCATAGATDLLALRRQDRASLYDLTRHHPPSLVPRERCVAVGERMAPTGVLTPLSAAECDRVVARARALEPEVVVVSLLHAYVDPSHEQALGRALASAIPNVECVCSTDVLPEIREYERTATAVAEAYLRPSVARYLRALADRLRDAGYPAPAVMTSAGGMCDAEVGARHAASLALSGPAGGVAGAAAMARLAGIDDALTIDIGGTSADAGLVLGGEPLSEPGGDVAGVPIALPRVLVETVSAGGGSIGWVDDGGALRVGPRSAGAVPGPAAFGRGGTLATLTDAHVVLGNLRETRLSGGVALDAQAARRAVGALATQLRRDVERTARGMVAAADAAMARALRRVSVERGTDPRRCALVAFGGGGPLHACALAELLDVPRVFIPPFAGVLSAFGLALAPERRETLASVMRLTSALSDGELGRRADALRDRGRRWPAERWWLRARYAGQGHELDVEVTPDVSASESARRFGTVHGARYGFELDAPVEVVSLRYAALGAAPACRMSDRTPHVAARSSLSGPAVLALDDATMLVAAGWVARPLPIGGWMLERQ